MRKPKLENVLKALTAILFASLLWAFVRYYTPIPNELETEERIENQLGLATHVLKTCSYLRTRYPTEFIKLSKVVPTTEVYLSRLDLPGICGMATFGRVIIFPASWASLDRGCYDYHPSEVAAHEFLHIIGLPRHDYTPFESNHDRLVKVDKDPIENTITACYEEAYAKAATRTN